MCRPTILHLCFQITVTFFLLQSALFYNQQDQAFAQSMSRADSLLLGRVQQIFAKDNRMPVRGIAITVLNGAVRLKGVVSTLAQKEWAEQIAYRVPGVQVVDNRLWVSRLNISDNKLKRIVEERLKNHPDSLFTRVRLKVKDGKVTLAGQVSSLGAKHTANEIISLVQGVQKIRNRLKIRDLKNRTDEQIKLAVEKVIRKKIQMSRDYPIRVSVLRGLVTLKGRVRTMADKRIALQTILFVPGVVQIVDRLEVLPE